MAGACDERMIEFLQKSIKRNVPLHQLEDYLDLLENAPPLRATRDELCQAPLAMLLSTQTTQ